MVNMSHSKFPEKAKCKNKIFYKSQKSQSSKKELNCVYFNARSIVNKMSELELLITDEQPDILGISETWLNSSISESELNFEGYTVFRKDRDDVVKHRGGGVALYIRNILNPVYRPDICRNLFPEIVFLNINCGGENTLIGVCYRPPDSQTVNDEAFFEILTELGNQTFVLMGDFNFSEIQWDKRNKIDRTHKFIRCLDNNYLSQVVNKPSRNRNFLDLIICSDENLVRNLSVDEPFESSDHQMIRFKLLSKASNKTKNIKIYEYFKADYNEIREHIRHCGWDALNSSDDINEIWSKVKTDLLEVRNKFIKIKGKQKAKAKWATKKSDTLRKKKKEAWCEYASSGGDNKLYEDYQRKLKLSTLENQRARRKFERRLADNIKNNSKSFYSYVSSKSRSNKKVGPLKGENGELTSNNNETAQCLNKYFCTVFTKENLNNLPTPPLFFNGMNEDALFKLYLDEDTVLSKLSKINVNKSTGPDEIHAKLVYELRNELVGPITRLFNLSLVRGEVPQDWRDANVSPIHKKGNRDLAENYRPVSLTCILGKILEGFIKTAIVDHLERFQLLKDSQHGFRSGRSCLTNLLEFFDIVTKKLDEEGDVDLIYLDFAKAFDKVPHRRLLTKLYAHGVRGSILNWVENWLNNRRQRVCVDGDFSGWVGVTSGVPQGSVLGPVLFLIYINDIDIGLLSKIGKFADDSKLLNNVDSCIGVEEIRSDLRKLEKWADEWQMQFNVDKCSVIHLGRNNPVNKYSLYNKEIASSIKERDLGVIIDKSLKFSEQCNKAAKSANMTLGMIKRNVVSRDKDIIVKLYKALVRPKLDYCVQAWRPYLKKDIENLEKVQRRATKLISQCRGLSYHDRLKITGLTTLEERRNRGDMLEVFKTIKGINKLDYTNLFRLSNNTNTRGHTLKLAKVRPRLDCRKHFFSCRVINRWNSLPQQVVEAETVNSFKNRYDMHYGN